MEVERVRKQPRNRRFAGAWWPPQDDRMCPALRHHAPDRPLWPDQVVLTHDLRQRLRPQPISQRPRRIVLQSPGFEQVRHALDCSVWQGRVAEIPASFTPCRGVVTLEKYERSNVGEEMTAR